MPESRGPQCPEVEGLHLKVAPLYSGQQAPGLKDMLSVVI